METGVIKYNLKERGRQFRGFARKNLDYAAIASAINSPACQECVKNRDMLGYFGHWPRVKFGMVPQEGGMDYAKGKPFFVEPALVTTFLQADANGNIEHKAEFLGTDSGQVSEPVSNSAHPGNLEKHTKTCWYSSKAIPRPQLNFAGAWRYALQGFIGYECATTTASRSRTRKGTRIQADTLERVIVENVIEKLQADEIAKEIVAHYRKLSKTAGSNADEVANAKRKLTETNKKIARLVDLLAETSAPDALLRQIESLEEGRDTLLKSLEGMESEQTVTRTLREISVTDVKRMLQGIVTDMGGQSPERLSDMLHEVVERITLDATTFEAEIFFRISPAFCSSEVAHDSRSCVITQQVDASV